MLVQDDGSYIVFVLTRQATRSPRAGTTAPARCAPSSPYPGHAGLRMNGAMQNRVRFSLTRFLHIMRPDVL